MDQDGMSIQKLSALYHYSIVRMKEYVVRNVSWLTKFKKGEHVLTDWVKDANGEVKVYKCDCDWDVLVNDNWNKVSYSLAFNRLKPTDVENKYFEAWTIEQRIMNKTFTDDELDKAADFAKVVTDFADLTSKLKVKLGKVANNLLGKVNDLTISADAYDADAFKKAMSDMKALADYLKDKPMTDIKGLYNKLVGDTPEDKYDPSTVLND